MYLILFLKGEGSYGKVYKAQHVINKGIYAVKIVNTTAGDLDNLKKEISILRDCSSEFVV
jgi:serine/threonine protein kinase